MYWANGDRLSYDDAEAACKVKFNSSLATLAPVRSAGEAAFLSHLIPNTPSRPRWVGIRYNTTVNSFVPTTFDALDLWYDGEPSSVGVIADLCVQQGTTRDSTIALEGAYLFDDNNCGDRQRSVCALCPPPRPDDGTTDSPTSAPTAAPTLEPLVTYSLVPNGCCREQGNVNPGLNSTDLIALVDTVDDCLLLCSARPECTAFEVQRSIRLCVLFTTNITERNINFDCACGIRAEL
jgi:hypothetical protein